MSYNNKLCNRCGNPINESQQFCTRCGNKVTYNYSNDMSNQYTNTLNHTEKKEKNWLLYVIIILLILLLTATLFVAYGIRADRNNDVVISTDQTQQNHNQRSQESNYFDIDNEYFFPSDRQLITTEQLYSLTKDEVALLRNEIYARHGYIFNSDKYSKYFSSKHWYVPNPYFDESMFNDIERINKTTIVEYEIGKGWR